MAPLMVLMKANPYSSFDGSNEVTELSSSDIALEGTRDGILERSALGLSLESTYGEELDSDEGIILI